MVLDGVHICEYGMIAFIGKLTFASFLASLHVFFMLSYLTKRPLAIVPTRYKHAGYLEHWFPSGNVSLRKVPHRPFPLRSFTSDKSRGNLPVHYVRFQDMQTNSAFSFLECMSLLSVMVNLHPESITIHTNRPANFTIFASCSNIITDWTKVHLAYWALKKTLNGTRIASGKHETDIRKFELLADPGGLVLDFDVFIIDGLRIRRLLRQWPCLLSREFLHGYRMDPGFMACNQNASYPRLVLKYSYYTDYRPENWLWNCGTKAMRIYEQHLKTGLVVEDVANQPSYTLKNLFLFGRDRRYDWRKKLAHHSFYHNRTFGLESLQKVDSSFGDMLLWILSVAKERLDVRGV